MIKEWFIYLIHIVCLIHANVNVTAIAYLAVLCMKLQKYKRRRGTIDGYGGLASPYLKVILKC